MIFLNLNKIFCFLVSKVVTHGKIHDSMLYFITEALEDLSFKTIYLKNKILSMILIVASVKLILNHFIMYWIFKKINKSWGITNHIRIMNHGIDNFKM